MPKFANSVSLNPLFTVIADCESPSPNLQFGRMDSPKTTGDYGHSSGI